jgi:hypothetical protein
MKAFDLLYLLVSSYGIQGVPCNYHTWQLIRSASVFYWVVVEAIDLGYILIIILFLPNIKVPSYVENRCNVVSVDQPFNIFSGSIVSNE